MQHYADWLCGLRHDPVEQQLLSLLSMGISYKTVQTHRARLLKKLKLTNTFQLNRYAIEHSRPVIAPAVVPMMPASMPIAYRAHSVEREEWPG